MTDYTSEGPAPVEDAAVPNPPTVDELLERQRLEEPEQYETGQHNPPDPGAGRSSHADDDTGTSG